MCLKNGTYQVYAIQSDVGRVSIDVLVGILTLPEEGSFPPVDLKSRPCANGQVWLSTCFNRLAAVCYRSKNVRTMAFPAVRSVNKSRGTQNCIRNEPYYAICSVYTIRLYNKVLKINFCALIWQKNAFIVIWTVATVTGQVTTKLQCWVWPVTTRENSVIIWSFKGPKLFCVL